MLAIARALTLLLRGKVRFPRGERGRTLIMEDGEQFTVFRHVRVEDGGKPEAVFIVRFTPARLSVRQNIRFSLVPMVPLLGLHGFREKYWCVDEQTGQCQGLYAWQTVADAQACAHSVAPLHDRALPARVGLPPRARPVPATLLGIPRATMTPRQTTCEAITIPPPVRLGSVSHIAGGSSRRDAVSVALTGSGSQEIGGGCPDRRGFSRRPPRVIDSQTVTASDTRV